VIHIAAGITGTGTSDSHWGLGPSGSTTRAKRTWPMRRAAARLWIRKSAGADRSAAQALGCSDCSRPARGRTTRWTGSSPQSQPTRSGASRETSSPARAASSLRYPGRWAGTLHGSSGCCSREPPLGSRRSRRPQSHNEHGGGSKMCPQ
jgi:hypothetical protein